MAATQSTMAYALKTLWPQKRVENQVYKNNPFLAMVRKDEKFTGANMVLATQYADSQGRSSVFATALANKGAHAGAKFLLTRAKDYWLGSVDTETILSSKDDPGSLVDALERETKSGMNAITRSLAVKTYGDGSGAIGAVGSGTASPITLATIQDITNFEVGMKITANPNKTGNAGTMRSGTGTITAINRDTGVITYSGTITSIAPNDYLYQEGDYDAPIKGLLAWLPVSAPTSTAFFGLDRSVETTRLGGCRIDISSQSPEEGLINAAFSLGREGGSPDYLFGNHEDVKNIQYALGSKVQYEDLKVGEIGFQALKVNGPTGVIKVLADRNCPKGYSFLLQMDTWALHSLGKAPRILNVDGNELLREYNADANEIRMAYYAQLGCTAPGWNAILTMPS